MSRDKTTVRHSTAQIAKEFGSQITVKNASQRQNVQQLWTSKSFCESLQKTKECEYKATKFKEKDGERRG